MDIVSVDEITIDVGRKNISLAVENFYIG